MEVAEGLHAVRLIGANAVAVVGVHGHRVTVEAHVGRGLPALQLTGLPGVSVQDARERVRPAVENSGLEWPLRRVTVNLSPADLRKEGPGFDLPIALAVLGATAQVDGDRLLAYAAAGEVSLRGVLLPTPGILAVAWERTRERRFGAHRPFRAAFRRDGLSLYGSLLVLPVAVYLLTWIPWLAQHDWDPVALIRNHASIAGFHVGLESMENGEPIHPYGRQCRRHRQGPHEVVDGQLVG